MVVAFDGLAAERTAVEQQLDLLVIRVHAHLDRLAFAALPIPVWEHVQHRLPGPPGAQVVEAILRKAACIQNSELRGDRRPAERRRFAAVIETGPVHDPGGEGARRIKSPPRLRVASGGAVVLRREVRVLTIVDIHTACRLRSGFLSTEDRLLGILAMLPIDVGLFDVVDAGDFNLGRDAAPASADRGRYRARGIEAVNEVLHRHRDPRAADVALDRPLLVADRPEDDARVIAIASDKALELIEMVA